MRNQYNILMVIFLLVTLTARAQSPQKMSYQSVVRNASGGLVANAIIGIKVSILQGSISGTAVFSETHNVSTNANGLVSIGIGAGSVLTGSFSAINWSGGPYFIKTETDPNGGSNYTISGTSQLLSVPYALYAENTKTIGKASIYLTGNITNEQAAAKLAKELGPYTENIYVTNTSGLTGLDLTAATSLVTLKVTDNADLQWINLNNVTNVYGNIEVRKNFQMSTLDFSTLKSAGDIMLEFCGGMQYLQFPVLEECGELQLLDNDVLATVSFPMLKKCIGVNIRGNDAASQIIFSVLETLTGTTSSFQVLYNDSLASINLPMLTNIGELWIFSNLNLTSLSIPSFNDSRLRLTKSNITTLTIGSLVTGGVLISENNALTTVSLPNFAHAYMLSIATNPNLTDVSLPALVEFHATPSTFMQNNHMSNSTVNYLLNRFLNTLPVSGKIIQIKQIPAAPPTGQGIIDKAALISQGNQVYTD
jgi:hypothetical protein